MKKTEIKEYSEDEAELLVVASAINNLVSVISNIKFDTLVANDVAALTASRLSDVVNEIMLSAVVQSQHDK